MRCREEGISGEDRAPAVHRDRGEGKLQVAAWRCARRWRAPRAGVKVITVADRESDFFEFITQAQEHRALFLIRARTDRTARSPKRARAMSSILEALSAAPVLGTLTVEIPGNGKRKARTASVRCAWPQVTIKAPQRRGKAKTSGSTEPISVNVIAATESDPPPGEEAISWVLLTNLPVNRFCGRSREDRMVWQAMGHRDMA